MYRAAVANESYCRRDPARDAHTEAVVILCGPVGESLLCDGPDPFAAGGYATGDMTRLAALGLSEAAVAAARADAIRLVSVHRTAIGACAFVLSQWGVLDGPEAAELFAANRG